MAVEEGQARQWAVFSVASAWARPRGGPFIAVDVRIAPWPLIPQRDERVVQVVTLHGPFDTALEAQAARLVGVGAYPDMGSALANSWRWNRQAVNVPAGRELGRV